MRLFQNCGVYRSYLPQLRQLTSSAPNFKAAIGLFLADRFGAVHTLMPVLEGSITAFFTNGDDEFTQRLWAKENGLPAQASLEDILLAQIENHRAEVFYNMDPMRYGDNFLARLPACVRRTIAWRAAPSAGGRFLRHDLIVNNFPTLLDQYRLEGAQTAYFSPAHDPEMDVYAEHRERPIDVLFMGTYSRHHRVRAAMLESIAGLRKEFNVVMHLDTSRYTKFAESPLGWVGPLHKDRRPRDIRAVTRPPVFGRDLLRAIGQAKIVVNGAIDMAGSEKGNMRIWESLGCGAALVSDAGKYPAHLEAGRDFVTYNAPSEAAKIVTDLLSDRSRLRATATRGNSAIRKHYTKSQQWDAFCALVS